MKSLSIFWPVVAQAMLTIAVAVRMYVVRVAEMRANRISPQSIANSRQAAEKLQNIAASDNFRNLFELPVLFFAICPILYVTDNVSTWQLILAWLFVALRCIHSFIQVTYNRVMHRFRAFLASMACVFAMWIMFAFQLAQQ
jgi:hypothetical protein